MSETNTPRTDEWDNDITTSNLFNGIDDDFVVMCRRYKRLIKHTRQLELETIQLRKELEDCQNAAHKVIKHNEKLHQSLAECKADKERLLKAAVEIATIGVCFSNEDSESGALFNIMQSQAGKELIEAITAARKERE